MPDKRVKLRLKMNARKRLQRLALESGTDHRHIIERALKALERARKRNASHANQDDNEVSGLAGLPLSRFRIRCEIEGQETAEILEQLQGFVNDIASWLRAQDVSESDLPVMLIALGAQCILEGERLQRFLDEQ